MPDTAAIRAKITEISQAAKNGPGDVNTLFRAAVNKEYNCSVPTDFKFNEIERAVSWVHNLLLDRMKQVGGRNAGGT